MIYVMILDVLVAKYTIINNNLNVMVINIKYIFLFHSRNLKKKIVQYIKSILFFEEIRIAITFLSFSVELYVFCKIYKIQSTKIRNSDIYYKNSR